MSGLKKFPDPPTEMVSEVLTFIDGFDSVSKAAAELGLSESYLYGVKNGLWPPSARLAAFCGWKVDRVWQKDA